MSNVPWSSRPPQRYILSVIAVVLALAIMGTGVTYISAGVGGIVPYLMIVVAPVLAVTYVYVFAFKKWDVS
jgi:hypothetical protein